MPNLFGYTNAISKGGYVASRFNANAGIATGSSAPSTTPYQTAVDQSPPPENWMVHGAKFLPAAATDIVDTVAALYPGVQRGEFNDYFWNSVGEPAYAQWIRDNQAGVSTTSGLAAAALVGWGTEVAMAKLAASGLATAVGVGRITAPIINAASKARLAAAAETLSAAQEGRALTWLSPSNLKYVGLATGSSIAKSAVSELAIVTALHKNDAIWSDDMSQNILFAGLGLGLGGTLGVIGARGAVSRWANSDEVQLAFAGAFDPSKFERLTTDMPAYSGKPFNAAVPKDTSIITAHALNARNDDSAVAGAMSTQASGREAVKTQFTGLISDMLQRVARRGNNGIASSSFSATTSTAGQHVTEALHNDPTILYGAASLGAIKPELGIDAALAERQASVDLLKKSKNAIAKAEGQKLSQQIPLVMVNHAWLTTDEASPFISYSPVTAEAKQTAKGVNELRWQSPYSGKKYTIREDGLLTAPGQAAPDFQTMPIQDILSVHDASNQMLDRLMRAKAVFTLPAKPHWSQLDLALEYADRGGKVDWMTGPKLTGPEEAQIESLKQKAIIADALPTLDVHARFRLNLPMPSSVERVVDPQGAQLKTLLRGSTQNGITTKDLASARLKLQQVTGVTSSARMTDSLDGRWYRFNRGVNKGNWLQPVLGFFDDVPAARWTRFNLADDIAESKLFRYNALRGNKNAPLVRDLTNAIISSPMFKDVANISGLADSQIGGLTHAAGTVGSQFLTQGFRFRNSPILLGAQALRRVVNRMTEQHIDSVFKAMGKHIDALSSIAGRDSRILLNQYLSHASGWDIAKVEQNADGLFEFMLDEESLTNRERLGRDVQPGESLINPRTGNKIVLDDLSNSARVALEKQMTKFLMHNNTVRASFGLTPIKRRPFFTPPPRTTNKFIGFTLDQNNKAVPGGAVVADSQAEFNAAAEDVKKRLKPGQRFMTDDEIRAHDDIWDQMERDFLDPTLVAVAGKSSRGALTSSTINAHALEDALSYLKTGYERVANGVVRSVYDQQLKVARVRSLAQVTTKGQAPLTKNIWQTYEETLMGIPAGVSPKGLNTVMSATDKVIDQALAAAWPAYQIPKNWLSSMLGTFGVKSLSPVKNFADLANQLGPYTPFKDAVDLAKYQHGIEPPWTGREVARKLNQLSASLILRWLEIPQAAMNMTGIITNMPGLISAQHVPMLGKVDGVPVIDSMKIMAKGFIRMTHERSSADWKMMVKNGDASQDVSEMNHQLSLLNGKNAFQRFLTGDPRADNWVARKGLDGVLGVMTDTSENMSRQWAHFVGLELADYHGITGLEARHHFARQIANDAIANYDPLNRPEIYQNALGSMYGLFLSYSQNYYQRMFKWAELGDNQAIVRSLAAQASLFGLAGVPGFQQVAQLLGGEENGDGLLDRVYKTYGPATGSVLAHGGLAQITTLLGLPPVALYTRGDNNFRNPASDLIVTRALKLPIGLETLKDIVSGTWQAMSNAVDPNVPNSGVFAAQTIARQMPNRALHGAITVLLGHGDDTDAYGNVMSETQGAAESAYRMLGVRSARQQSQIDAYYMNQQSLRIDSARLDTLRSATRSLIRNGQYERLPEVFQDYLASGGKPWNYHQWIESLIRDARNTRTQNQLLRTLRSPTHQELARRIQDFTAPF